MAADDIDDTGVREAATARVLQRRMTNPTDRNVLRVVSAEFGVDQRDLEAWVAAAAAPVEATPRKRARPRFSPVVTTKIERARDEETAEPDGVSAEPAPPVLPVTADPGLDAPRDEPAPAVVEPAPDARPTPTEAALQAEADSLRHGNEALKAAMRALLD